MRKPFVMASAALFVLLLLPTFAHADSAMYLYFNGGLIAPSSTTGCGSLNFCSEVYVFDGLQISVDTGAGTTGGGINLIQLNTTDTQLVSPLPAGSTIDIKYVENNYTSTGTDWLHTLSGTLYGTDTATASIFYDPANTLLGGGTLVHTVTCDATNPDCNPTPKDPLTGFFSYAHQGSGAFAFSPVPFALTYDLFLNVLTQLEPGQELQTTSAFRTVPEPASLALLGSGLLLLGGIFRRKLLPQ